MRGVIAAVCTALIVGSVGVALTVGPERAARIVRGGSGADVAAPEDASPAPELAGVTEWLNSEPMTLASLRGRVVLVDFWTYTCINCRRTFPFLRGLHETYGSRGLTVIGVHSPEFDFEAIPENVERAVKDLDVTWPVAMDPDKATWDAYRNQYWPADYLIDANGLVRAQHIGEGDEAAIEDAIRSLLPDPGPDRVARPDSKFGKLTPELYFGYERGGLLADGERETFDDPPGPRDKVRLKGTFEGALQWLSSAEPGATVTVDFTARDVYAVLGGKPGLRTPELVEVLLNDAPVPPDRRGRSVFESRGRTFVAPDEDMYHLVTGTRSGRDRVSLKASVAGVRWFTFTFGG